MVVPVKYLCQRSGRTGWYVRYPVERRLRAKVGRNAIERKAGNSLSEAKRNMHRLIAEIQQEIAVKCGEADDLTRWKQEHIEPPAKGSIEYEVLVDEIDQADPEQVKRLDVFLDGRKTFEELIEERVLIEQPRLSTQRNWNTHISQLKQWSKQDYPHVLTKADAADYRKHLLGRISHNSARASISCLKGMWSYGVNAGYLEENIWAGLTRKLEKAVKHELPSDAELARADEIAGKSKDLRYLLMRYTGARKGEVNGLRWCDIDLKTGVIAFTEWEQGSFRRRLKGGRGDERRVPIHSALQVHLEGLMQQIEGEPSDPIWPKAYKQSDESWGAGWAGSFRDKFGFTSHDLRRIVVTRLMVKGVSPFVLYSLTRHKVPGMSDVVELYTRPKVEELREAIQQIN